MLKIRPQLNIWLSLMTLPVSSVIAIALFTDLLAEPHIQTQTLNLTTQRQALCHLAVMNNQNISMKIFHHALFGQFN
ncbi:hypothetical protein KKJ06_10905 [Xenorhabdus bovienii]|uniref:hypothetical protein n=1 Tax=Xenorhabdus bovienii TaxID=40576 RepID=UPI0023B2AF52|nr:hypothetical protein [Xenorhabdus bovienii]MDE9452515.1 hypothetical protein [Xenorhabdus bovienii]MDE9481284.1 hypothetical protein [Xenorhabdus bovienii]MDE9549959.1 hypothetical protein [Xenorhabdus bovienii]MDE9555928.1 hypothetical protein [Xenorhabdus bovienii]